jgi:hypothetical protein
VAEKRALWLLDPPSVLVISTLPGFYADNYSENASDGDRALVPNQDERLLREFYRQVATAGDAKKILRVSSTCDRSIPLWGLADQPHAGQPACALWQEQTDVALAGQPVARQVVAAGAWTGSLVGP